jgi:hypothetical protein
MIEKIFPIVNDGNTPTLFVNAESAGQISIERANGGLVKISLKEAARLREALIQAEIYLRLAGYEKK